MEPLHKFLTVLTSNSILLFELMGVLVIILAGLRGVYQYIKKSPQIRLDLAKGMALGLEFKLGGEILRTVMVRDFKEIMTVGCIILLRAALTFLIHWEIKEEMHGDVDHSAATLPRPFAVSGSKEPSERVPPETK